MKDGIIVCGGGGHAKVCIELFRSMGRTVAYCLAVDGPDTCLGVPVLRGDAHLQQLREEGYEEAFIALGSNAVRRKLGRMAQGMGYRLANAISPAAIVSPSARLGAGVAIMAGAVINAECVIEDLSIINTGACIDHDCHIGQAVHIAPQCGLAGNVQVGAASFLGIGCKVIPGVVIGEQVTVGAGGVVIADLPSGSRAVGVPARAITSRSSN
jgi:UDP-perosamine 4-acetyltransferase